MRRTAAIIATCFGMLFASSVSSASSNSSNSSSSSSSSGAFLEPRAAWEKKQEADAGFYAETTNFRSVEAAFHTADQKRREQSIQKKQECFTAVRTANRDSLLPVATACYRAVLTIDLEILRKERQFIESMPGVSEPAKANAILRLGNLSDAISTIITAMDAGVFTTKESLEEAKNNLGTMYRAPYRLAKNHLRANRALHWINHLLVRLDAIRMAEELPTPVLTKLDDAIACLEAVEEQLGASEAIEDNNALIEAIRQGQSDEKFCMDTAREARDLNTEFEQADAENSEEES